jgi:hypothetical protein
VCADAQGNAYVCGGTASRDFPTTPGAYDRTFHSGDTSGEECDAFVCKFGPDGRLLWLTDGPGGPTRHAYQAAFAGGQGDYGTGDGILAKFTPTHAIPVDPGSRERQP